MGGMGFVTFLAGNPRWGKPGVWGLTRELSKFVQSRRQAAGLCPELLHLAKKNSRRPICLRASAGTALIGSCILGDKCVSGSKGEVGQGPGIHHRVQVRSMASGQVHEPINHLIKCSKITFFH